MSWSIDEHIGEGRPWPAQVVVYRGETDECLAYVSGEVADRLQAENDKLREQIHWLKQGDILHVLTDQEYIDQCERERLMQVSIDALDKESAKLRKAVDYLFGFAKTCGVDAEDLRELGVEVDG